MNHFENSCTLEELEGMDLVDFLYSEESEYTSQRIVDIFAFIETNQL